MRCSTSAKGHPLVESKEERFYEVAAQELISGMVDTDLYAKACAESGGKSSDACVRYLQLRVCALHLQDEASSEAEPQPGLAHAARPRIPGPFQRPPKISRTTVKPSVRPPKAWDIVVWAMFSCVWGTGMALSLAKVATGRKTEAFFFPALAVQAIIALTWYWYKRTRRPAALRRWVPPKK